MHRMEHAGIDKMERGRVNKASLISSDLSKLDPKNTSGKDEKPVR